MRRDPKTGADFILVGKHSSTPLSFQAHRKLKSLLDSFTNSTDYDLIILDSPPILAVSDTRMLAGFVDDVLFVVRWAKTRRVQVDRALKEVMGTGCKVGGIVLSMVDVKRHSQYGFGDSGLYTGHMRRYYCNAPALLKPIATSGVVLPSAIRASASSSFPAFSISP